MANETEATDADRELARGLWSWLGFVGLGEGGWVPRPVCTLEDALRALRVAGLQVGVEVFVRAWLAAETAGHEDGQRVAASTADGTGGQEVELAVGLADVYTDFGVVRCIQLQEFGPRFAANGDGRVGCLYMGMNDAEALAAHLLAAIGTARRESAEDEDPTIDPDPGTGPFRFEVIEGG